MNQAARKFLRNLATAWPTLFLSCGLALHVVSIVCHWRHFGAGWGVVSSLAPVANAIAAMCFCWHSGGIAVLWISLLWMFLMGMGVGLYKFGHPFVAPASNPGQS